MPSLTNGYEIFYMGGVRGIYNSTWLGVMAAALPIILLWLPGFYLLRSQITEDSQLKIGQIIASTPISKLRYIGGKFLANFTILILLDILFTVGIMIMQLIRMESMSINFLDYLAPLIFITVPHLLVLAALTIIFDVIPFLRGSIGNISIFIIWVFLTMLSFTKAGSSADLFGIGYLTNGMLDGAKKFYPSIPNNISFGYYANEGVTSTFNWEGMQWDSGFLQSRLIALPSLIGHGMALMVV